VRELFIVACTRARKEKTELYRSLLKLGTDRFLFIENNRKGLSAIYNSVLDERAGRDEILIFVHDDVTIGDLFLQEKLTESFNQQNYAIAGLAGTSDFTINSNVDVTWLQPPPYAWSGAVEHVMMDGSISISVYGPTPRRCVVLDGLFLAVDLKKIGDVRFDGQFAFHFYDLDFCLTAHEAGLALGTVNVYVTHGSEGSYSSPAFKEQQAKFRSKWKAGSYRIDPSRRQRQQTAANLQVKLPVSKWQETLEELPICLPTSAWVGHIPFAFLLFKLAKPRTFVELGVDLGASFLAACEATHRFHTETCCVGIDTWQGDEHAGFTTDDIVFEPLKTFVTARYPSCDLLRQTFDQAAEQFEDKSIDVLHIDGLHTYEAVAHDFTMWRPKLSNRSIVLFHDTAVRQGSFGVWKFWNEIKTKYRHFEFEHSFGLGVLLTGTSIPGEFEELVEFISASQAQALLFQSSCNAAALELSRRVRERGSPKIGEIALMKRLVMQRDDLQSSQIRLRRNELCYCGSGRKYKHCHGRWVDRPPASR
jgi:Methyltransferase domain/Glycosyltransferase like family/SEC-C motif